MNYYPKFIYKYAHISGPLHELTSGEDASKKRKFVGWMQECEEAFLKHQQCCCNTPILAYADYSKPFKLHTDASELGLGAVLYQRQSDGTDRVIAYANHTMSKSECKYDAHKLEFLAL